MAICRDSPCTIEISQTRHDASLHITTYPTFLFSFLKTFYSVWYFLSYSASRIKEKFPKIWKFWKILEISKQETDGNFRRSKFNNEYIILLRNYFLSFFANRLLSFFFPLTETRQRNRVFQSFFSTISMHFIKINVKQKFLYLIKVQVYPFIMIQVMAYVFVRRIFPHVDDFNE